MSSNFRTRDRLPFNFIDGIAIEGIDISHLKDLANPTGSTMIGHNAGTVKDALDQALSNTDTLREELLQSTGSELIGHLTGTVQSALESLSNVKADKDSPELTGAPTTPTPTAGTNDTQIANAEFVATAIASAITATKQALFPIGSVYTNADVDTNPAILLGFGTWTAFGVGRVLVGQDGNTAAFDTMGETGGNKDAIVVSHTHTASTAAAGSHSHSPVAGAFSVTGNVQYSYGGFGGSLGTAAATGAAGEHTHGVTIASSGASGLNANLQPYVVVKMWKRTA